MFSLPSVILFSMMEWIPAFFLSLRQESTKNRTGPSGHHQKKEFLVNFFRADLRNTICTLCVSLLSLEPTCAFTHTHRQADCMYAVKRAICAYHFWECDASYGAKIYNGICEPTCSDIPVSIRLRGCLCRVFCASKLSYV
jgi:hypothetical protein